MKRSITSLLLVILICTLALMGCAQSAQAPAEPVNIRLASEYPQNTEAPESSSVKKTVYLEVNGKEYTAQYKESEYSQYNKLKYNIYSDGNNKFKIYEDSDTLKGFDLYFKQGNNKKTFEECKQIASDYASQYISVDDYKFTFEQAEGDENLHFFDFTRYIDDTPTDDTLGMATNTDGEILSFWRSYSDAFSDGDFNPDQVRSDIEYFKSKEVYDKMDSIARAYENYSKHNYVSSHLVSLGDKKYGMEYVINVDTRVKVSENLYESGGECLTYVVTR